MIMVKRTLKNFVAVLFIFVLSACSISEESINSVKEEAESIAAEAQEYASEMLEEAGQDMLYNYMLSCYNGIDIIEENKKYAYEIMRCLEEKDADGILNILCEETKSEINTKEKINEALEFFEGNIIDYGLVYNSMPNMQSSENGKKTFIHCNPELKDIATDSGKVYIIRFSSTFVSEEETEIGVNSIVVFDENYEDYVSVP